MQLGDPLLGDGKLFSKLLFYLKRKKPQPLSVLLLLSMYVFIMHQSSYYLGHQQVLQHQGKQQFHYPQGHKSNQKVGFPFEVQVQASSPVHTLGFNLRHEQTYSCTPSIHLKPCASLMFFLQAEHTMLHTWKQDPSSHGILTGIAIKNKQFQTSPVRSIFLSAAL